MDSEEYLWQNIAQLLKCPSCAKTFRDPILLLCGHRFCKNCIVKNATTTVNCLICAKVVNYIDCKYTKLLCVMKPGRENVPSNVDAFDLLLPTQNRRKWQVDKTYLHKNKVKQNEPKKILRFQNAATKEMILEWLSNTENQFQRCTQSQEIYDFYEDDNNSFNIPSVSQNKIKLLTTANTTNKRLQSHEVLNLRSRKIKRPQSLNLKRVKTPIKENLNIPQLSFSSVSCNYNIEEFDTGPKFAAGMEVPSVQKNIIQHLEDDFLNSIETEVDITKYNTKTCNIVETTVPISGWDRMKQMRKTVCKGKKKAKQLKSLVKVNNTTKITTKIQNTRQLKARSKSRDSLPTNDASKVSNDKILSTDLNANVKNVPKPQIRKRGRPKRVSVPPSDDLPENVTILPKLIPVTVRLNKMVMSPNTSVRNSKVSDKNVTDTEIIDLTHDSPLQNKSSSDEKEMQTECEIIKKDICRPNNDKQKFLERSLILKPNLTKNKMSLKLPANLNHEDDVDGIFLLDTHTPIASPNRNFNPENYVNDAIDEQIDEEIVTFEEPLINDNVYIEDHLNVPLNENIVLQNTQNCNDAKNVITTYSEINKSTINFEIEKLQTFIETSTNLEEHKNMFKCKLDEIKQLFQNEFCIKSNVPVKLFESIGVQTDKKDLFDTFVQTVIPMQNIDIQTDCLLNLNASTQTSEVVKSEIGLQTIQIEEDIKETVEFGVQVEEADLNNASPKTLLNDLQSEINRNLKQTSQTNIGKTSKNSHELLKTTADTSQSKSSDNIISATQFNKINKTISTENILDDISPSLNDPLNVAIILTASEGTFSKPNSPIKKTQNSPKTQVDSIGIISQTQASLYFKRAASKTVQNSTLVESVPIITQTQMTRSPMKLFKAKAPTQKDPSNKLSAQKLFQTKTKSIEEAELSDDFDHLEYDTADILAGGEVSFQKKLPVTSASSLSNIEISVASDKPSDKVVFDKSKVRRMKRIRFPDDTDSDEEQIKPKKRAKNKYVRDDLSIEFHTGAASNANSDDTLPDELPDVFDNDLADDFNFEDCIRNIEKNFDPNYKKSQTPTKDISIVKPSISKLSAIRNPSDKHTADKKVLDNRKSENQHKEIDNTVIFKSPIKRAKRSILSELICPEKSPVKINVLENVVLRKADLNKSFESDLDDIVCSDESFEENTKLRTLENDVEGVVWRSPEKINAENKSIKRKNEFSVSPHSNKFQLPSLGETPDMFNLPSQVEEDIFIAPPPEFANTDEADLFSENSSKPFKILHKQTDLHISVEDNKKNDSTVNNPIDTSTQRQEITQEKDNYDILSLSPIKNTVPKRAPNSNTPCPLVVIKRNKPRVKPLNISNHSTPKVKQNSIYKYIKRTQNRLHLNNSSSSLFEDTESLLKEQNNSQTKITNLDKQLPCIASSRLNKDDVIAVTSAVQKKLITFKNTFEKSVTHLIVSVNKNNFVKDHTMKYISAVSLGIWIVNSDWIKECIKRNEIVKEDPYEVLDVSGSPGPKEARLFRDIRPLLSKFRILASPPFRASERTVIEDVVRNLGGSIVSDAVQFLDKTNSIDLVITEASSTQSFLLDDDWLNVYKVATVDIEWLSRSVGQYKVLSFLPFLLCDADEIQDLNVYPQELLIDIPGFTFSTQPETQ